MTSIKAYSILFCFFAFISCGRKTPVNIEIETKNPVTGEAITGVMYNIYEFQVSSNLSNNSKKSKLLVSGITDANGKSAENFEENSRFGYEFEWNLSNLNLIDGTFEVLANDAGIYILRINFRGKWHTKKVIII